jgi:ABC-type multidrug transport system fused ATPase/permease subunit
MMDAPIVLFDETTTALDTESERLVQEALRTSKEGRAFVLVAYRLATIRHADRIIVMDHGKVVEAGTHEQLLQKDGFYKHLIVHQLH